jgi:hypothetical protein
MLITTFEHHEDMDNKIENIPNDLMNNAKNI